ncbi:MAG: GvpL/GvpF family gas vesicle protein [Pseudomonadota bacterium]
MTKRDLVAFLSGAGGFECPKGLTCRPADAVTAVFDTQTRGFLKRVNRKAVLGNMVRRQAVLEQLMACGTVLPVLPGTRLAPESTGIMGAANAPLLARLVEELAHQVQFQIKVYWPRDLAAARFGWTGQIAAAQGAAKLAEQITGRLSEVTTDLIELPRAEEMLLNVAVLLPATDEARLDTTLEEIDAVWPDGFAIRQVGPSPAVSFGSIGLRSVEPDAVRSARRMLGISQGADLANLAEARRSALIAAGPEAREGLKAAADILEAATRCGRDHFHHAFVWREGQSAQADDRLKVA